MTRREPGAREYQPRVAVGDRDRDAGADNGSLPRLELRALAGGEIEPRIAVVGLCGKDGIVAQPRDRQLRHTRSAAELSPESATR